MVIYKGFRYRIYPTEEQVERIFAWQGAGRWLWNLAHEQRLMGIARTDRRYVSAFDQINDLKALRAELPWLADVPRDVCAAILVELDKAWQCCFKKIARRPRWKSKHVHWTPLIESHPKAWWLEDSVLHFPKLGEMRAVVHRPLEGTPKTCTITRDGDQWFCSIRCVVETTEPAPPTGAPIAIDRGVTNILADSNGRLVPGPIVSLKLEAKIRRAQRVVSRRKKGSKNRDKAKVRVARLHRKARRQREHFLHVESTRYAKNHSVIVLEDLKLRNMTRSARGTVEKPGNNVTQKRSLNRAILSSGLGRFGEMTTYKSVWRGGTVEKVYAQRSSQTCAIITCAHVDPLSRNGARFCCTKCGNVDHADVNAAKVLLSRRIDGVAVCGGAAEVRRPVKQKLRVVRRGTRHGGIGLVSDKASVVTPRQVTNSEHSL